MAFSVTCNIRCKYPITAKGIAFDVVWSMINIWFVGIFNLVSMDKDKSYGLVVAKCNWDNLGNCKVNERNT